MVQGGDSFGKVGLGYAILIGILALMILWTVCAMRVCASLRACVRARGGGGGGGGDSIDRPAIIIDARENYGPKIVYTEREAVRPAARAEGGGNEAEGSCSICLDDYQDGETLKPLPGCGHSFHALCINASLSSCPPPPSPTSGSCPICLDDYRDGETLKLLPGCGHSFHALCIDAWLPSHASCPVCRTLSPLPTAASSPLADFIPLARRPER